MNTLSPVRPFQLTGWHVLAIIVGFFAIVIAVDVTFAISAYHTFPGEVSATPYEDGVAYNRKLAQLKAQSRLGWAPVATVSADGAIRVEVRDGAGRPVRGLRLTGRLERPATEAGRIVPTFREAEPGVYLARPGRLMGAWDATLILVDPAGSRFEAERRLTWP
jgi:nitrogen fixation protein FixH